MYIVQQFLLALGGITVFLLGLKFMSSSMEEITGEKMKALLKNVTNNKYMGVLFGGVSTALIQSSIATNVIVVGFVSNNILTFYEASSIIMGANIGTTVTAQLVSLSGSQFFDITAFGSLILFTGFILTFFKKRKVILIGNIMVGFGMLFLGLDIVNDTILVFKNYDWFRNIFLIKNDLLLLLNGLLITSIVQSSSAVTSIMIILAGNELLSFENSMFLILGANIGTCLCVIVSAINKGVNARRTAFFNFAFNFIGAVVLFVPLLLYKSEIASVFYKFSHGIEREIANFHTLFNLTVTFILLPILKPFTNLIKLIIKDEKSKSKNNVVVIKKLQKVY